MLGSILMGIALISSGGFEMRFCNNCGNQLSGCGLYDENSGDWYCTETCVPIGEEVFWTTFDFEEETE